MLHGGGACVGERAQPATLRAAADPRHTARCARRAEASKRPHIRAKLARRSGSQRVARLPNSSLHIEPDWRETLGQLGLDRLDALLHADVGVLVQAKAGREVRRLALPGRASGLYLKRIAAPRLRAGLVAFVRGDAARSRALRCLARCDYLRRRAGVRLTRCEMLRLVRAYLAQLPAAPPLASALAVLASALDAELVRHRANPALLAEFGPLEA